MLRWAADRTRSARGTGAITGELEVGDIEQHLIETLSTAGFLEDENFAEMEAERKREFARAGPGAGACRGGVSGGPGEMRETMAPYMDGARARRRSNGDLFAIAAPHVSPEGGWQIYRAAYEMLRPEHRGSHVRDSGDLALWRAGAIRPDAQDIPHAVGRCADGLGNGGLAGGARRRRRSRWKTTATPSNTPWNCR